MFYQSIKHRKSVFYCFLPKYLQSTFLSEMAKNILFEEIYLGVLCEAAESFEAEINITNKGEEEAETVEKSRFSELSEGDLDVIVDCAEAQATKNATKWGVKLFEGKH